MYQLQTRLFADVICLKTLYRRVPILAWLDVPEPASNQQDANAAGGSLMGDGDDGTELYEGDWQQQEEHDQQQQDYNEEGELLSLSGGWFMSPCMLCCAVRCPAANPTASASTSAQRCSMLTRSALSH